LECPYFKANADDNVIYSINIAFCSGKITLGIREIADFKQLITPFPTMISRVFAN